MKAVPGRSGRVALLEAENAKLRKINQALMGRVERSMDLQGNDFSLFETAILLEGRVNDRTSALKYALEEQQRLNAALEEAKSQADEANLSKTRFLAAASHDILQPLNAARLFLSALADGDHAPETSRLIGRVDAAFESVERLLGALLDISKLDAGVVRPAISSVDLGGLLRTAVNEFEPVAQSKGIKLRSVPVRCTVRTDGHLLMRVVRNFLSNAIRYTRNGTVLLGCRRRQGHVRIEVYDTGAGMPPDKLEEIFEEFRRLVGAAEDFERGSGLGLAIVRRIAQMLNHPLSVRSTLGAGSCFAVEVPVVAWRAKDAKPKASQQPDSDILKNRRILVIENEPSILDAMAIVLGRWGCRVTGATSLGDAEAALGQEPVVPHAIVADYHLDDGADGLTAINIMRSRFKLKIPGVVVTADRTAEVRRAVDLHGCVLLNKPMRPARLRSLLTHLLTAHEAELG